MVFIAFINDIVIFNPLVNNVVHLSVEFKFTRMFPVQPGFGLFTGKFQYQEVFFPDPCFYQRPDFLSDLFFLT